MTCSAGSPWAKTGSFLSNLATLLPRPVESRNCFTSKARFFEFARRGTRRTLTDTLRLAGDTIAKNNMRRARRICSKLHSLYGGAQKLRLRRDAKKQRGFCGLPAIARGMGLQSCSNPG